MMSYKLVNKHRPVFSKSVQSKGTHFDFQEPLLVPNIKLCDRASPHTYLDCGELREWQSLSQKLLNCSFVPKEPNAQKQTESRTWSELVLLRYFSTRGSSNF